MCPEQIKYCGLLLLLRNTFNLIRSLNLRNMIHLGEPNFVMSEGFGIGLLFVNLIFFLTTWIWNTSVVGMILLKNCHSLWTTIVRETSVRAYYQ